jgi:hypothetical protein
VAVAAGTRIQGLAADHHPGHRRVTGQPPARLGFQRPSPADLPTHPTRLALQAGQVDDDAQLGPDPTSDRQLATLKLLAGQVSESIRGALPPAAGVVVVGRAGQRLQGREQGLAGFGVMMPRTATIRSKVTVNHTPRRS